MSCRVRAVVLAAGRGRRLGADKALLDLEGQTAISRLVEAYRLAGITEIGVVRGQGASPLAEDLRVQIFTTGSGEMIDSLRAALSVIGATCGAILCSPVDYPLVSTSTVAALVREQAATDPDILLPLCDERPGHPILISQRLFVEILNAEVTSLREVIRRDPSRVRTLVVDDPWILSDIDLPEDLEAARASLRAGRGSDRD